MAALGLAVHVEETSEGPRLSAEQKRQFFRDGVIVIKQAVPLELTRRAREAIEASKGQLDRDGLNRGGQKDEARSKARREAPTIVNMREEVLALFNNSKLSPLIQKDLMGPVSPLVSSHVAVIPAFAKMGIKDGGEVNPHIDGGWSGTVPEKYSEILAAGKSPHSYFKEGDPASLGPLGGAPLWVDPNRTLSIGSYTAIVGVALNDQTKPGKGQFAVRRGAHFATEAFFRMQRDAGGPVGAEGPEWPRLVNFGKDRAYAGSMPEALVKSWPEQKVEVEGWPWPKLTPALLEEGDAVVALYHIPHTGTPNYSPDPRMNVYFKIRRQRAGNPQDGNPLIAHGVSDHPDRGLKGQFLDYDLSRFDPYKTSIEMMCDCWREWDGMRQVVAEERRRQAKL